jgi:hypothetical protein
VDVHASFVLRDDAGGDPVTYSVSSATLGGLYYLPLDGEGDVFVPVGLNSTT